MVQSSVRAYCMTGARVFNGGRPGAIRVHDDLKLDYGVDQR